jgi:hypothetical protein
MLIAAIMVVAIYTIFIPVFAGRKHFFIGISLLAILPVLAMATHAPGLS